MSNSVSPMNSTLTGSFEVYAAAGTPSNALNQAENNAIFAFNRANQESLAANNRTNSIPASANSTDSSPLNTNDSFDASQPASGPELTLTDLRDSTPAANRTLSVNHNQSPNPSSTQNRGESAAEYAYQVDSRDATLIDSNRQNDEEKYANRSLASTVFAATPERANFVGFNSSTATEAQTLVYPSEASESAESVGSMHSATSDRSRPSTAFTVHISDLSDSRPVTAASNRFSPSKSAPINFSPKQRQQTIQPAEMQSFSSSSNSVVQIPVSSPLSSSFPATPVKSMKAHELQTILTEFDRKFLTFNDRGDPVYPLWTLPYVKEMSEKLSEFNRQENYSRTGPMEREEKNSDKQFRRSAGAGESLFQDVNLLKGKRSKSVSGPVGKSKSMSSSLSTAPFLTATTRNLRSSKTPTGRVKPSSGAGLIDATSSLNPALSRFHSYTIQPQIHHVYQSHHSHFYANQIPIVNSFQPANAKAGGGKGKSGSSQSQKQIVQQLNELTESMRDAWREMKSQRDLALTKPNDSSGANIARLLEFLQQTQLETQRRMETLQSEQNQLKTALFDALKEMLIKFSGSKNSSADSSGSMSHWEDRMGGLRHQLDEESERSRAAQSQLAALQAELQRILRDRDSILQELAAKRLALEKLEQEARNRPVSNNIEELEADWRARHERAMRTINELEMELAGQRQLIPHLESAVNSYLQQLQFSERSREDLLAKFQQLQALFDRLQSDSRSLKSDRTLTVARKWQIFMEKCLRIYYRESMREMLRAQLRAASRAQHLQEVQRLSALLDRSELDLDQMNKEKNAMKAQFDAETARRDAKIAEMRSQLITLADYNERMELDEVNRRSDYHKLKSHNDELLGQLNSALQIRKDSEFQHFLLESFLGDYQRIQENTAILTNIYRNGDQIIHFSDFIDRMDSHNMKQRRLFVISDRAIYSISAEKPYEIRRRIPLSMISYLSLSRQSPDVFVVHCNDKYDYYLRSLKRSEILYHLLKLYRRSVGKELEYKFGERIYISDRNGINHREINITGNGEIKAGKSAIMMVPQSAEKNFLMSPMRK